MSDSILKSTRSSESIATPNDINIGPLVNEEPKSLIGSTVVETYDPEGEGLYGYHFLTYVMTELCATADSLAWVTRFLLL